MRVSGLFICVETGEYKGVVRHRMKLVDPETGQVLETEHDGVPRKFGDRVEFPGIFIYGDRNKAGFQRLAVAAAPGESPVTKRQL